MPFSALSIFWLCICVLSKSYRWLLGLLLRLLFTNKYGPITKIWNFHVVSTIKCVNSARFLVGGHHIWLGQASSNWRLWWPGGVWMNRRSLTLWELATFCGATRNRNLFPSGWMSLFSKSYSIVISSDCSTNDLRCFAQGCVKVSKCKGSELLWTFIIIIFQFFDFLIKITFQQIHFTLAIDGKLLFCLLNRLFMRNISFAN